MNFNQLTDYIDSLKAKYGVPACDCTVYYKHENVFRHSAGYSDIEGKKPVSPEDLYYIFSATKPITIAAVMQLMEKGKLHLTDPVELYISEYRDAKVWENFDVTKFPMEKPGTDAKTIPVKNKIRIIDLMTMTAGLSYDTEAPEIKEALRHYGKGATTKEIVSAIAKMPLMYEPGTHWLYSLAHDVLAAVVEIVSGQMFGDYLKENIFQPLGIHDAYFKAEGDLKKRISALYIADEENGRMNPTDKGNLFQMSENYQSGGAGIVCTVDAYGLFIDALCNYGVGKTNKRILSAKSIDLMRRNYLHGEVLEDFKRTQKIGYGYGLGVRTLIDNSCSKSPIGEFGWDGAAGAYLLADPQNQLGIFYAQHTLRFMKVYQKIHPAIRDLTYEALNIR